MEPLKKLVSEIQQELERAEANTHPESVPALIALVQPKLEDVLDDLVVRERNWTSNAHRRGEQPASTIPDPLA